MYIQTNSHNKTAGKEEIFTEVSSFFMNNSEYRSLLPGFPTFGKTGNSPCCTQSEYSQSNNSI